MNYYNLQPSTSASNLWWAPSFYPGGGSRVQIDAQTDWQRAAVKAEPEDEFSWLRRRVREVEELAFA